MEKVLELKFKYTEKEYCEAVRLYYSNLFKIKVDIFISIFLIIAGAYFWETNLSKLMVLVGILYLLMLLFLLYINPKRTFKKVLKFHDEYNLAFKEKEIIFQTININSTISWKIYLKVKENNKFFYLIQGKDMFTIIPKRAFSNREEEELFKEWAHEKIEK